MAGPNVQEFTDSNFEAQVLHSAQPVLVDFWAEWCMPCKMLGPTIDALADQFVGAVKVDKEYTDSNRNTAVKYGITAIPTVILFKGGQPVKRFQGLQKAEVLAGALREVSATK